MAKTKPDLANMTDDEFATYFEGLDVDELEWKDAGPLREIAKARTEVDEADAALRDAVASAREAGMTWSSIGTVLRVSRQAAQQRFG